MSKDTLPRSVPDWKRIRLSYWSEYTTPDGSLSACYRLGFISYWLIKWIHGPLRLTAMSARACIARGEDGRRI